MEEDKRFAHIKKDPKFRRIPKNERKVKIDKRFESMFNDKKFKVKYTVDKRGRPVSHTSTEDLKRYYELSSEEESDNESNELNVTHKTDGNISEIIKKKLKNLNVDYARGESTLFSESSSDDEESEEEVSDTDDIDHKWGELDADAETTEEATPRLAACNMDWDRIRAVDLMVLFNSFLPAGGIIKSVIIYPSEFGKKRLQEEEVKGPIELVETPVNEEENETEEGSKYHMEKLRQYQLNRLKYYYAVITFDSPESANKIYTECDGMEYESSATKIDLRFIPDDMEFADEPKEVCDKLPETNKYQPRFFTTTALQQAKVDLTWDETDPDRIEITEKINSGKIDELNTDLLKNYLAGSSDEEELSENEVVSDNDESKSGNSIEKYKALLQDIEEKEKSKQNKDVEMEISWGTDLKEKTEKLVKQKLANNEEKTPFEQYLEKRKEKRKEKRAQKKKLQENSEDSDMPSDIDMNDPYFAEEFNKDEFKKKKKSVKVESEDENDKQKEAELELLLNEEDDKKHFSLKKIQEQETNKKSKKRKKSEMEEKSDEFQVNVNDERFSALFTSHHYNIDPTDPHYKKTKAMETLIQEKLKRRNNSESTLNEKKIVEKKRDPELSLLVKSVKRKTQKLK